MSLKIARIDAVDTYTIRQKMLRPDGEIKDCIFENDEREQSFHLGGFIDSRLVSIASFYFEKHPILDPSYQFRLRGMATLEPFQGQGLSSALLKMAFPIIKQNYCTLLWCNARISALGFYQKVGFEKIGHEFNIPHVGPHILCFKEV